MIKVLDSAMTISDSYVPIWRGVTLANVELETAFTFPDYLSFSTNRDVAMSFIGHQPCCLCSSYLVPGQAYLDLRPYSSFNEEEIVLPRGTSLYFATSNISDITYVTNGLTKHHTVTEYQTWLGHSIK